jgi:hypothetical protein
MENETWMLVKLTKGGMVIAAGLYGPKLDIAGAAELKTEMYGGVWGYQLDPMNRPRKGHLLHIDTEAERARKAPSF